MAAHVCARHAVSSTYQLCTFDGIPDFLIEHVQ